jgi:FtsZ-interacting cell division protein YlmF
MMEGNIMGLFGHKKDKNQEKIQEKNHEKKYNQKALMTAFDLMQYFIVKDRSDEELFKLCDTILDGKPVLANFDKLSVADCNYILAFMSGVVYAKNGKVWPVGQRLYLFAREEELNDGSLEQYVEDNVR